MREVGSRIDQCEVNLNELSRSSNRDRNKIKGAISRYAIELDGLVKDPSLDWETLSKSAASFFTSIEHLNSDDWVQSRLNLASDYEELRTRHTAVLSLVKKNVEELLKKDPSSKSLQQLREF